MHTAMLRKDFTFERSCVDDMVVFTFDFSKLPLDKLFVLNNLGKCVKTNNPSWENGRVKLVQYLKEQLPLGRVEYEFLDKFRLAFSTHEIFEEQILSAILEEIDHVGLE